MKHHYGVIVSTHRREHWFRKRYYLICWECTGNMGPFKTPHGARVMLTRWERRACPEPIVISEEDTPDNVRQLWPPVRSSLHEC